MEMEVAFFCRESNGTIDNCMTPRKACYSFSFYFSLFNFSFSVWGPNEKIILSILVPFNLDLQLFSLYMSIFKDILCIILMLIFYCIQTQVLYHAS